jgi:hypothetical protein
VKIMEIIATGQLRRIEYEKTDDIEVMRLFQGVYGAGQFSDVSFVDGLWDIRRQAKQQPSSGTLQVVVPWKTLWREKEMSN